MIGSKREVVRRAARGLASICCAFRASPRIGRRFLQNKRKAALHGLQFFSHRREKRKVDSAECSTILHLILAVKGELSSTSFTVTSPQRQAGFEASLKGVRSVVHSATFQP